MKWRQIFTRYLSFSGVKFGAFIFVILYILVHKVLYDYSLDNRAYFIPRLKVTSFMLDTVGCKIPSFDPCHPGLHEYFGFNEKLVQCSDKPPLTYQENSTLKINESVRDTIPNFAKCQYEAIHRVSGTDDEVSYSNPVVFTQNINVSEEFLRVSCLDKADLKIYRNYHAFLIPKPKILDTLKQRDKERRVKDAPKEVLNVMMVGIDALSRYNHIVKMPKTRDFLLTNLSAIELEGYNKVAENTVVNLTPMFTGKFLSEEYARLNISDGEFVDNFNFVFKNYSEIGYSVLLAEDHPSIGTFNYVAQGFKCSPADYYFRPFTLSYDLDQSVWNNHFCVMDRPETNIVLDYSLDFMQGIKDVPKFSYTFNTRLTHDSIPLLSTADNYYYDFLVKTLQSGILNNTIFMFFGDHGYRFGEVMKTDYGYIQSRLPLMYFVFPTWFSNKYSEIYRNVVTNSKRLTTPFDIHALLEDILHFTGVPRKTCSVDQRGISLFDCIPESRSCEDAHIPPHYCTCQYEVVDGFTIGDEIVQKTSKYVLDIINNRIYSLKKCPHLKLYLIRSAKVFNANSKSNITYKDVTQNSGEKWRENDRLMIKMTFQTTPGGGEFESTVMYKLKQKELFTTLDSLARIDQYGSDGDCVHPRFRPFCYCS